ncbi:MAG: hypothetical protein U9Q03_06130 [Patescibacteria group bacterium]|nr:hypothetical protein [Patescibacteria group bacterium]
MEPTAEALELALYFCLIGINAMAFAVTMWRRPANRLAQRHIHADNRRLRRKLSVQEP